MQSNIIIFQNFFEILVIVTEEMPGEGKVEVLIIKQQLQFLASYALLCNMYPHVAKTRNDW